LPRSKSGYNYLRELGDEDQVRKAVQKSHWWCVEKTKKSKTTNGKAVQFYDIKGVNEEKGDDLKTTVEKTT